MARFSVLLLALGMMSTSAQAHLLKVFAFADGNRIEGATYFVGGAPASGASVKVVSARGDLLATLSPDTNGEFSYDATPGTDYVIVADTGDGHVAEWTVTAGELTGEAGGGTAEKSEGPAPSPDRTDSAAAPAGPELATLMEQAVARQVRPLREQIIAYEDQVRLRDIVGGIGYIIGLAGLAAWWQQRRRSHS